MKTNPNNSNTMTKKLYSQKTVEYMLYGCIIIGIILSVVGNNFQHKTKNRTSRLSWIHTTAAGYMTSAIALILLIPFFIYFNTEKIAQMDSVGQKFGKSFSRIIIYPLPAIITTAVFIFASIQTLMFQSRFAENRVANDYYTWINTFSFLVSIQTLLLAYYAIFNKKSDSSLRYVIYLIGLFNIIILGITQVILQFFSTDG